MNAFKRWVSGRVEQAIVGSTRARLVTVGSLLTAAKDRVLRVECRMAIGPILNALLVQIWQRGRR